MGYKEIGPVVNDVIWMDKENQIFTKESKHF